MDHALRSHHCLTRGKRPLPCYLTDRLTVLLCQNSGNAMVQTENNICGITNWSEKYIIIMIISNITNFYFYCYTVTKFENKSKRIKCRLGIG